MGRGGTAVEATREARVHLRVDALEGWLAMKQWTQTRLAAAMGMTHGQFSHIIHGRAQPGPRFIARLLTVTGMPFETFFEVRAGAGNDTTGGEG